jgi:lysozyme
MRLLLLFILFPFSLFAQNWRGAIVDSLKGAGSDLKSVSRAINNNKGATVLHIGLADSAGYVLLTVRVHIDEGVTIPRLSPAVAIRTGHIAPLRLPLMLVPPQPPIIIDEDTISPLPPLNVVTFKISLVKAIPIARLSVPPMPDFIEEPQPMLPLAVLIFNIGDLRAAPMDTLAVPPMPDFIEEPQPVLLTPPVRFAVAIPPPRKLDTVFVPDLVEKRMPVEEMHLSNDGYSLLEKLEGFSPELYTLGDGGFTIGFGFFVPYSDRDKWDSGLTFEEAEILMREKVPQYEDQVKKYINVPLTQAEFDALTMMAYNLGGFSKATCIVNDINGGATFDKLQHDWMRFVHSKAPNVMKGLMNRRRDEVRVRSEWEYQNERKILIYKNHK